MHFNRKVREYALQALYSIESIYYKYIFSHYFQHTIINTTNYNKINIKIIKYILLIFYKHFCIPKKIVNNGNFLIITLCKNIKIIDSIININLYHLTFSRLNIIEKNILRIAVYEILFTKIPNNIIINEAIEITKKYAMSKAFKFINGILNNIKNYTLI